MNDVLYVVHTNYDTFDGYRFHILQDYESAIEWCEKNDGFLIQTRTKELFPKHKTIYEKECKTGKTIFLIKKKTRIT